jgi:hypothetical protein
MSLDSVSFHPPDGMACLRAKREIAIGHGKISH